MISDRDGRVCNVIPDRLPRGSQPRAFDRELWSARQARADMAASWTRASPWIGRPLAELVQQLGAPDGQREFAAHDWQLVLPLQPGLAQFASFVYCPNLEHEWCGLASRTQRIGAWAYVEG